MTVTFPVPIRTKKVGTAPDQVVYYPQASGLPDKGMQRMINGEIVQQVQRLIDFQTADGPSAIIQMIGSFELKNNQRQVLSLTQSNYAYHAQAAHGMTYMKSLTFDLAKGKKCRLPDLFKTGSNYNQRLRTLIEEQIKERGIDTLADVPAILSPEDFYIADETLVIYFQLYEITPYVYGFPTFPIPVYKLQDIIKEDGPLGR